MLLRTTVPVWRISRCIALLALLLPAACSETPAPNDSPFYLAPARDTAASTPSGRDMEQPHGMSHSGGASSMQNGSGIGPDASPTGLPSGSGSASFGTGSSGSSSGE